MDMYNCLKMPTSRFRKLFASLFVFAGLSVGAQAASYYWVGGASGNWSDPTKWSIDGTTLTPQESGALVPGSNASDIVNLISAATITVNSDIQIAELWIPNPNLENSTFTVTITGSKKLTITTKIETFRPTATGTPDEATSTLIFDCNVTSPKLVMHSGGNIKIAAGKNANITTVENQGGGNPETLLTVNGSLQSTSISLLTENTGVTTRKIEVGSTGKISTGSLTGTTGSVSNAGLIVTQDSPDAGLITSTGSGTSTVAAAGAFVWTGDTDNDWTKGPNWLGGTAPNASNTSAVINIPKVSTLPEIPAGTSLSFAADNLNIDTDANVTVHGELELTGNSSSFDLSKISTSSTGSLSVSGNLSNSTYFSASNLSLSCGTFTSTNSLTCKSLSVSGETTFTSDSNLTLETSGTSALSFGGSFTQNGTGELTINSSGNVTFSAATQVNSLAISASGKDVSFSDTISSSSSLSVTAANLAFDNTTTVKDITISATTSTGSNMTVTGNWTNNGAFSASAGTVTFTTGNSDDTYANLEGTGTNNFNNIEIQRNIKIKNDVTLTGNFTANKKESDNHMGGRNIMFANGTKLTVTGNIDLKGRANSGGARLRLCGINIDSDTWELECNGTSSIQYVNFKGCSANPTLQTINCTDSGGNSGFLFPGQLYKWVGGESGHKREWDRPANWSPATVPSAGADVEIQAVALASSPVLTADLDIKTTISGTDYGTILVAEGATFDIAGYDLTLVSITNEGTLRLTGEQSITGAMSNGSSNSATVEYYDGTGTLSSFVWDGGSSTDKAYTNLTISRDVSISDIITVSGKTIINADANLTNSANSFSSTGKIKIGDYSSTPKIQAGDVKLYSGVAVTIDDAAYAQSFSAYCPVNIHDITTTGGQTYNDDVTLSQSGNTTFTAQNASNVYQTIDFKKDILISGTGSKRLILNSNTTISNSNATIESDIQTQAGTSFIPSTETTTFKADLLLADNTVNAASGTIILNGQNKASGTTASLTGNNTFYNLTFSNAVNLTGNNNINGNFILTGIAPVTIAGNNTINNFTAGSSTAGLGGKLITIGAGKTQTISGKLTLIGTSNLEDNRLVLRSSSAGSLWTIHCTSTNNHEIQFVDLQDSNNTSNDGTSDYNLFALNSNDSGNNTKWNFPGMEYTWTGATTVAGKQNDWNTATNWAPASVPGLGANITIPSLPTGSNYPVLPTGGINIADPSSEHGTITIEAAATGKVQGSLDFNGQSLTAKSITNSGLVRLKGNESISATMKNGDDNQSGTVEYYDSEASFDFVWDGSSDAGKQYANLVINRPVTQSTSSGDQLIISGTTTISAASGTVNLSNENNSFGTYVKIGISNSSASATDVTLKAKSAETITIGDGAYANSLTVENPVKLQNVTTTGNQIYNSTVTINAIGTTSLKSDNTITFNDTVSGPTGGSNTNVLSVQAANININCSSITTERAQTFIGAISLGANTVTLTSNNRGITFGSTTTPGSINGNKSLILSVPTSRAINFYGKVG